MKKNFITVFSIFLIFYISSYSFAYEENYVNSTLIEIHDDGRGLTVSMIVPLDQKKYPLINKNPLLFFLFVSNWDEKKIDNIKMQNIKRGNLSALTGYTTYGIFLPFSKIEGFTMAAEIANLDKFELLGKRGEIITNLKQCYSNYKEEYNKYLYDIFIFTSCPKIKYWTKLKGYEEERFKEISVCNQTEASKCWDTVRSKRYNIDTQTVEIPIFGFWVEQNWENLYDINYNRKKYGKGIPEVINIPLPVDKAKELFSNSDKAYYQTFITAKPLRGWMRYYQRGGCVNFKILNIRKIFSAKGLPVYTYDLSPNVNCPF